jgi:hypothetical protein
MAHVDEEAGRKIRMIFGMIVTFAGLDAIATVLLWTGTHWEVRCRG